MRPYLLPFILISSVTFSSSNFADDLNDANRERHAFHLGQKETPENISLLVTLIQDPKETLPVKLEAVTSLMQMESNTAFSALATTLKDRNNQYAETRALAAAALCGTGDPRAIHPLLETLEDEQELVVQWKILKALGALGTDRSLKVVETYTEPYHPTLLKKTALQVMAEHKKEGAFEKLSASLQETDDPDFQTAIVMAFGELGDPRAEVPLRELYSKINIPEDQPCCISKEPAGPELKLKIAILETLGQLR